MALIAAAPIRRLPPAVADAIAAGEVVERPASVVKELVENALDAGARRIMVNVQGGGVTRIIVADDGRGIPAQDLPLAVARHATSKISTVEELAGVTSLGFRGEALASIAAVADLRLTSRPAGAAASTLRVRGAETLETGLAAGAEGTTIEVCDLFFNTPARLRFLRSERAEAAAVVRALTDIALTRPQTAIKARVEGRIALATPGGTLDDAMGAVYGRNTAAELISLAAPDDDREGITIAGFIGQPRAHRGSRAGILFAVNGRPITSRALTVALEEAYRGLLPMGRYPFGVVHIEVDPAELDVNVHPTKREIRFRNERAVFAAVQRACWRSLESSRLHRMPLIGTDHAPVPVSTPQALPLGSDVGIHVADSIARASADGEVEGADGSDDRSPLGRLEPLRALGQVGGEWLVAESPVGVVIVDPHAAHEKILYEQLRTRWDRGDRGPGGSQLLLIPAIVECAPPVVATALDRAGVLRDRGIIVEAAGPAAVRCLAVPSGCAPGRASRLVRDALDALGDKDVHVNDVDHRLAALIACHAAVRFGDQLGMSEQQRLLDQLARTGRGITCPHGRPTVLALDESMLRRAFHRS